MSNLKKHPTPYRHSTAISPIPPKFELNPAVERCTASIASDPTNYIPYCNRSSANLSGGRAKEAIQDAKKAISLQPDHSLPYYRLGLALKQKNSEIDAIVAFSQALSRDVKNQKCMNGLCELTLSGRFGTFTDMYCTLCSMGLEQDSFILISSVGNELINLSENKKAVTVLQSARLITTDKMKVKSTLLFSLADLYWALKDMKNAILVLEENLQVCNITHDKISFLRCCSSLAHCFTVLKQWTEAIDTHAKQINVALSISDFRTAMFGYSSTGECYSAMGQHALAVTSHRRAILYAQRIQDKLTEAKEHCYAGCALISAGRLQQSLVHLQEHLQIAREQGEVDEQKRALSNLSQCYFMLGGYHESFSFSKSLLTLSTQSSDHNMVTRAFAGMGKAHQAMDNFSDAVELFTEQLKHSRECSEPVYKVKALANLAFAYEASGDNSMSLKYGYDLLSESENIGLTSLQAKAYGVLGKNYSSLGNFSEALKFYKLQIGLRQASHNPNIHLSTLCEVASCYADMEEVGQAMEHFEQAVDYAEKEKCSKEMLSYVFEHYGQFLCNRKNYKQALAMLEKCLEMTATSQSRMIKRRICRELAICYEEVGNLEQSIHFYKELFRRGKEEKARHYILESLEKLQSIHRTLGDTSQATVYGDKREALEIESLSIASSSPTRSVSIAELARRGEDMIQKGQLQEALTCFEELLDKARVEEQPLLEGVAYVGLARICQKKGDYQEAIYHLKNDVLIRRALHDLTGEVASLERLGDLCFEGEMYEEAESHFENQLEVARQAKAMTGEVRGLGKLGKVLVKLNRPEDALSYYNQELTIYANNVSIGEVKDQAECCANIGDIQLQLDNLPEALSCHTQHLALVQQVGQPYLQIRAYGAMGKVHLCLGQHDDALMCYEKKQKLSRQLENQSGEVEVYGEKAAVYISIGSSPQAVSCFRHQRELARSMLETNPECLEAKRCLFLALTGLADVYFREGMYGKALENEYKAYEVANQLGVEEWRMQANGNLAEIHEKTHNFQDSIIYRETQLQLARNIRDSSNIANSLLGLGRCQFYRCDFLQATISLKEALKETCELNPQEQGLEGRVRYYLGLAYLHFGEMQSAQTTLLTARPLIDGLVNDSFLTPNILVERLHMLENLHLGMELSLVSLDRPLDALVAAECRKNTRFLKYVIYRYKMNPEVLKDAGFFNQPMMTHDLSKLLKRISQTLLVYSVAYTKLHIWVLRGGLVQFKQIDLTETTPTLRRLHTSSLVSLSGDSCLFTDFHPGLAEIISQTRDSIGISTLFSSRKMPLSPVLPFTPLLENSDSETGSVGRSSISSGSSKRSANSVDYQPSTDVLLAKLYRLLIEPVESNLPSPHSREFITFVLDRELHLIPFPLLSPLHETLPTLARTYKLLFGLSLQSILQQFSIIPHRRANWDQKHWVTIRSPGERNVPSQFLLLRNITRDLDLPEEYSVMLPQILTLPLVIASPHFLNIDTSTSGRIWCMKPAAEKEARRIGSILKVKPILRNKATRGRILEQLCSTNCAFYSGQVSWETMELILIAPNMDPKFQERNDTLEIEQLSLKDRARGDGECERLAGEGEDPLGAGNYDTINSEDILLSNLEQMNLFVLSGHCLASDSELDINDVISFAHIILSTGVKSVLLPIWTSPDNSSRTLLMSLFNGLSKGGKLVTTFQRAMEGVQGYANFSHPLNWAGYMILGSDVTLQEMNPAPFFKQLISYQPEDVRKTLTFLKELLIEAESLIMAGCSEPNIISQSDVERQAGTCEGWREILHCAGFIFNNGIPPEIPDSMVYPSNDDTNALRTCLTYVTSLLEMDKYMLSYLQNLREREILIYPLLRLLKLCLFRLPSSSSHSPRSASELIIVGTEIYAWNSFDCQEMLKYIGYELKSVSATDVQLQIPKQHLTKSYLQAIISCLHALFGPEDLLPRIVFESDSSEATL